MCRYGPFPFALRSIAAMVTGVRDVGGRGLVLWARERCRISPPRFLAECCKRQLNQGSFSYAVF